MPRKRKFKPDPMRYAPRRLGKQARPRPDGLYYEDFCCSGCFWDWGVGFARAHLYKHDCTESNYRGLLKKYWKPSYDYFADEDLE